MADTPPKKSDLGVRTLSAVVMLAVSGTALWLGGWWWGILVSLVGIGVLREWALLVARFPPDPARRLLWFILGLFYIGVACAVLIDLRSGTIRTVLAVVSAVIATDIGAYFAGRAIGGPKIAPKISPSKTWAGLGGGILCASLAVYYISSAYRIPSSTQVLESFGIGIMIAITAQSGDFFESWMKRRAGIKDSGNLIPGHGGLFDRVDGLLAVCFVLGIVMLAIGGPG